MNPGYLLIMGLSLVVGAVVRSIAASPPLPLSRGQKAGVLFGAVVGGTTAAKIPFLFDDWRALTSGMVWIEGGRTLTLGLLGGYLGVEVAKWALGIKAKTGDTLAAPLAASVGVGRIGCFFGGCCFGTPSELRWAHDFGDGVRRHPTQLYEAAFHFAALAALLWLAKTEYFARQRVKLYFICYFVYRFVTEWLRPEPKIALGLTLYQWTSALGVVVMAALWMVDAGASLRHVRQADALKDR